MANLTAVDSFGIPMDLQTLDSSGNTLETLAYRCYTSTVAGALQALPGGTAEPGAVPGPCAGDDGAAEAHDHGPRVSAVRLDRAGRLIVPVRCDGDPCRGELALVAKQKVKVKKRNRKKPTRVSVRTVKVLPFVKAKAKRKKDGGRRR